METLSTIFARYKFEKESTPGMPAPSIEPARPQIPRQDKPCHVIRFSSG